MHESVLHSWFVRTLLLAAACCAQPVFADPLHEIAASAYQHENSGWIFPQRVAAFVRVGAAQMVDGSDDAIAYYERVVAGVRKTALVHLHANGDGDLPHAPTAGPFKVQAGSRTLDGLKSIAANPPERDVQYWFDTGMWAVEVKATLSSGDEDAIDAFVRELRWDTLPLTDQSCVGPACGVHP